MSWPSARWRGNCATSSKTTDWPAAVPAPNPWVVLKFGGTSVSTPANWQRIADILRERLAEGVRPVVVHSALSKITDSLESLLSAGPSGIAAALEQIRGRHLDLARGLGVQAGPVFERFMSELAQDAQRIGGAAADDSLRARIMAKGELLATVLGAQYLNAQGLITHWVDVRDAMKAERRLNASVKASILNATCDFSPDQALQRSWAALPGVLITQGFIASDEEGRTVLLGRGGSDTSSAYLAAKLTASRLEIWTDVPGMFSANPRDVPSARLLRSLHYDEAQEIASNGAKVLHPRCILPVRQYRIPLHVYATQAPHMQGTVISANVPNSAAQVKAIAIKKGITLVSMESPGMWHQVGFLADAFQVFKQHGLSVDLVSTSETNVTVSLDP
ncbi:MAG: aspartate kinase, partial [Proteobacteria bacterium]|nr:aspartate kinase [Pseudomonadota bacterium]